MRVEIFSDEICPWSHIGKLRPERAVANLTTDELNLDLIVAYRPFRIDPTAPLDSPTPFHNVFVKKFCGTQRAIEFVNTVAPTFGGDDQWSLPDARDSETFERISKKMIQPKDA